MGEVLSRNPCRFSSKEIQGKIDSCVIVGLILLSASPILYRLAMSSEVISDTQLSALPQLNVVKFMGREIPRSSVEKALFSATAFLVVFNTFTVPFVLPKVARFLGAPYLPSSTTAFRAVLERVPQFHSVESLKGMRMVDIGSGDGRLVREAARAGFESSIGIEMNPWLALISKWRLRKTPNSKIVWANAWDKVDELSKFQPDVITFYGRPGQGLMTKFGQMAENISDSSGKSIIVVSNKFHIPNWHLRQIAQVGDFIVYKLHSNRE